jgi:hypothetical protein
MTADPNASVPTSMKNTPTGSWWRTRNPPPTNDIAASAATLSEAARGRQRFRTTSSDAPTPTR